MMKEGAVEKRPSGLPDAYQPPGFQNLAGFFRVFLNGQTYRNLLYLFLAFPLGLVYFVFLVTGLSLGLSLLILWVGVLVLPLVAVGWWACAAFERKLAMWLLAVDIPSMGKLAFSERGEGGFVAKAREHFSNPVTWKSLVFLIAKFPFGLLALIILVLLISFSGAFLIAPFTYHFFEPRVWFTWELVWEVDTLGEALFAFFLGVWMFMLSLHGLNWLAWLWGRFARLMLGNYQRFSADTGNEEGEEEEKQNEAPERSTKVLTTNES
jgi:hypothetical protein